MFPQLCGVRQDMAIYNLFSKRKAAAEQSKDDVYSYDTVPAKLRSQLKQMYHEAYENDQHDRQSWENFRLNYEMFELFVGILRREYGMDSLGGFSRNKIEEFHQFIDKCDTDQFLDCAEMYGKIVNGTDTLGDEAKKDATFELNHRFREAGLGYEFVEGHIVRIDSTTLHAEVLKPTIAMLTSSKSFKGAEQEIHHAFSKYRSHDNKGAVADALKALESTMKAILDRRGWAYGANDPASKLIAACFDNGLIPSYMQTHFGALRTMLESGVPTVRNKTSGHGQGSVVKPLEDHYASYVLYTALANMKLLIDCDKALP